MSQYFVSDFSALPSGWTTRYNTTPDWSGANPYPIPRGVSNDWTGLSINAIDGDSGRATFDVQVSFTTPATLQTSRFLFFRGSGADESATHVHFSLLTGAHSLGYCDGSDTRVNLVSHSASYSGSTTYRARINGNGSALKTKVWLDGDPEPGSWQINTTDSTVLGAGWIGFCQNGSVNQIAINWIGIGTGGDDAPTSAVGGASGSATLPVGYAIRSAGSATLAAGYAIRAGGSATLATGYAIRSGGASTLGLGYAIRSAGFSTLAAGYSIRSAGASTLAVGYEIEGAAGVGSATLAVGYAIRSAGAATLPVSFAIRSAAYQALPVGYAIRDAGVATLAAGYAIRSAAFSALPVGYAITATGFNTLAVGYAISSSTGGGADPADVWNYVLSNGKTAEETAVETHAMLTALTALLSTCPANLALVLKLLRNKQITDPATGLMTVYDDDGTTVLLQGNLYEDAAGATAYRGQGAERRERLS